MLLSELILKRRKELGLSQVELSRRADLHQRMISDIERGVARRPNLKSLQALSRELKVPMSQLLMLSGHSPDLEDAERLVRQLEDSDHDPYVSQVLLSMKEMDEGAKKMLVEQARMIRRWQRDLEQKLEED